MNFEEMESVWNGQPCTAPRAEAVAPNVRALIRQLRRRALYLKLLFGFVAFGLVFQPLLFAVSMPKLSSTGVFHGAVQLLLSQALLWPFALHLWRRIQTERRRAAVAAASVREALVQSLAGVEARLRDFRASRWQLGVVTLTGLFAAYANQAVERFGWDAFWPRALFVVVFNLVIAAVIAGHCRHTLEPERKRLSELTEGWRE